MFVSSPKPEDFDFDGSIVVDINNEGFKANEIAKLTPALAQAGSRGLVPKGLWPKGRDVPPALQSLKSEFGYQTKPLFTNLVAVAEAQKTALDGSITALLPKYNFFILQCGVYILPAGGEQFEALKFEVSYKNTDVSTFAMMPGPQTDAKLKIGGKVEIGVNGSMGFAIPDIAIHGLTASATAKAKVETTFIYSFNYELKTPTVDSFGIGNSFCRWLLHEGKNLRNDILFYPIIMMPKELVSFDCEFKAYFKIDHSGWTTSEFFLKPSKRVRLTA